MPKTVSYWLTVKDQADNVVWEAPVIGYEEKGYIHINGRETERGFLQRLRELANPDHKLSWEKAYEVIPNTELLPNSEQEVI